MAFEELDLIVIEMNGRANGNLRGASLRALGRFVARARRVAGLQGDVHILITSSRALRQLNRQFRKKDKPTDVLSFPPALAGGYAGDIAISAEIAVQQAQALGHSLAQELKVLMLHGILHLAGYDHETDDGEMARKEERLRRQLGLTTGLIRRTGNRKNPARGVKQPS
jgi:probable rRNA maturation factor